MSRIRFVHSMLLACGLCGALLAGLPAAAQQYDQSGYDAQSDNAQAPGRVARLAYLSGQVQFAPAGANDWGSVEINRPMVIGDRLLTGDDGRAVLELGDASVRIDNDSAFDFLNLTEDNVQIELSQGTLNLAVRQLADGANFEVDTPTVAFVAAAPGVYRIDNDPSGTGSMVTVFSGSGTVYGENGVSRQVVAGTSYRFNDSALASVDVNGLPQPDGFDRFCETRDANYRNYAQQQQQYIPPEMIGGDDLYQYGQWNSVPEYGNVWYPSTVPSGWAPYRYGHWAWIDPWGWTWVDNQPWGFAPFHYGRWVYVSNRWGWMPGPVNLRPVYAPALVAFIGGSGLSVSLQIGGGGPVGWFPLGPRDVYVPWFHASRNYFTNVNVTNIRNVYVNKTVINNFYGDYRAGRVPPRGGHDYAYRNLPGAVTAVPRNVFTDARPVHPAVLRLNRDQIARTQVALRPDANPGTASLGLRRPTTRPIATRGGEPFARPVVARHQPPPRPVEFAARQKVIASQHGEPLTPTQMRDLRSTQPGSDARGQRVKLVGMNGNSHNATRPATTPPRPAEPSARVAPVRPDVVQRPAEPSARRVTPAERPDQNGVRPVTAPTQPDRTTRRSDEMPSARFAHPDQPRTLPRAPVIRPAGEPHASPHTQERLPVVRPIERAPQSLDARAAQQQRAEDLQAQQRTREQQMQQQRQAQDQAQQRLRTQQADQQRQQLQQRQAQLQTERDARAQQLQQQRQMQDQAQQQRQAQMREQAQQQRQAQMQDEQRARAQQMQEMRQQREVQMQQRREQPVQRPVERAAPRPSQEHREPPQRREHPPESSGN